MSHVSEFLRLISRIKSRLSCKFYLSYRFFYKVQYDKFTRYMYLI
jgi:hypothetical protein